MQEKRLEKRLLEMVDEDVGFSDITSAFSQDKDVSAQVIVKEDGVVSGMHETAILFRLFGISAKGGAGDGARVHKGQVLYSLKGSSRDILIVERTALNILSRMSGISSLTARYVKEASKAGPGVRIAATRKTTPLFGFFEKKAVKVGGGDTHRESLQDEVLIKNNHLKLFGSVNAALKAAKEETSFTHKIEIEVENSKDAVSAAECGADIIMLDNMSAEEIKRTVDLLKKKNLRDKVLIEASGGVTLENVRLYAGSGVDVISVGRLTHSAPSLDMSLRLL